MKNILHSFNIRLNYFIKGNQNQMNLKNQHIEMKNLLQDTVMKIPFFMSNMQTNILAMQYDQKIMNQIQHNQQIVSTQVRLHYSEEKSVKTIILAFEDTEKAKQFKKKHDSKESKFSQKQPQDIMNRFNRSSTFNNEEEQVFKADIFFCQDISFLDGILYQCGRISIINPSSKILHSIINEVSKMVYLQGIGLQEQLKRQAQREQCLQFVNHKLVSGENLYYRWKVYSYLQGDRDKNYRNQPFQIVQNGAIWYPPPQTQKYTFKILNLEERIHFTKLLRNLTIHKRKIEEAMVFCIFNIENAVDICAIITVILGEICFSENVSEEKILPYLYLLSDIFFNSTTSMYRDIMKIILPNFIFKASEKIQRLSKIQDLVDNWKKKFVFEEDYFKGLSWTFEKKKSQISQKVNYEVSEKNSQQVESMCYTYGLAYFYQDYQKNVDNLILMLSSLQTTEGQEGEPIPGAYDGEQLTEKDIQKIRSKTCKVITCDETSVRSLFDKQKLQKYSSSVDKE